MIATQLLFIYSLMQFELKICSQLLINLHKDLFSSKPTETYRLVKFIPSLSLFILYSHTYAHTHTLSLFPFPHKPRNLHAPTSSYFSISLLILEYTQKASFLSQQIFQDRIQIHLHFIKMLLQCKSF